MMKEEKLFVWFTVALILCLVVASYIVITLDRSKEPFSSISFLEPDRLPEVVRVNSQQTFAYEVMSFEREDTSYNLTSTLELYRLYDVTEGLYRCLSPYRKKYYLGWDNETSSRFLNNSQNGIVQDLVIEQEREELDWEEINLYFNLDTTFLQGDFVIYYGPYNATADFIIRINTQENKVYFNEEYVSNINLTKQNNRVRVSYDGSYLIFVVNNEELFRKPTSISPGQFGFESRNALFNINNMLVSQFFPIEIPDRGNVINYDVEDRLLFDQLYRVRNAVSTSYNFIRQFNVVDEAEEVQRSCIDFQCTFTDSTDQSLTVEGVTNVTDYILQFPTDGVTLPFWHIAQEEVRVPWYYFNITGDRPLLSDDASISLMFDEKLALVITNKSISLLYVEKNNMKIKQHPYNQTFFYLKFEGELVTINTTQGLISYELPFDVYDKFLRLYTINSAQTVSQVTLEKLGCEPYTFCRINILPSVPRRIQSEFEPEFGERREVVQQQVVENDYKSRDTALLETIPSTVTSFNGAAATVTNSSNFSFTLETQYLDGEGILDIIFYDMNDTEVYRVEHNVQTGSIRFGENITETYANPLSWRRITLEYKENLSLYFNNTYIGSLEGKGPLSGYFAIETVSSHLEIRKIRQRVDDRSRNLPLLDDPCRLRLVYSEVLREESFTLIPKGSKRLLDSYRLENFFDYGKVTVKLDGSSNTNNTPLSIHYWLVRE